MNAAAYCTEFRVEKDSSEIVRGLRRRDPELLDRLIEQYQHRLFRYLMFLMRDRSLAEDLFQETWLRVMERGGQYNSQWKFDVWLLAIARNLAIDQMRRRNRVVSIDLDPERDEQPFDAAHPRQPSTVDALIEAERQEQIASVLDRLPAYYREVLTLRFHEGMTLEEIAQVTGAPLSTVKSRLRRALQVLAQKLESMQS
ncbi:MAG TPA: sigma-70 family RNA polymerase sigma factor [Acidobacteriota bacterium]|jgi:RNA polymerase sigma-70 factor (ECF subfamily)